MLKSCSRTTTSTTTQSVYNCVKVMTIENPKNLNRENSMKMNGTTGASEVGGEHRVLKLKGYVGFDQIATQHVNRAVKDGFAFNILCIGETGIGKSTLMDTLFNSSFHLQPSSHHEAKVRLDANTVDLWQNKVRLKLTIVETSGFGDQINKENSHEPIISYIDDQFEHYVQLELNLNRNIRQCDDTRVHVCLYFISPTGHSLKTLDLKTMKALDRKCNIIPIIAKADTVSKNELIDFKKRIMSDLINNHVNVYQFPINDYDLEVSNKNAGANALYPLAVIGSTDLVKVGNTFTRGRHYEWGTVSVENESHCDFVKLREMLLSVNLADLIEITHLKHYQLYRATRLREIGLRDEDDCSEMLSDGSGKVVRPCRPKSISEVFLQKLALINEEREKKELELKEEFLKRVKDKDNELKEAEKEINAKYSRMKKEQLEWTERIESKRQELEQQIKDFSERKFTLEKSKLSTLTSNGGKSSKKR